MAPSSLQEQLTKYLTDAHAIERQALIQMKLAPRIAGDDQIAAAFQAHLSETEEHERTLTDRLAARGAKPSIAKDVAGTVTGAGFGLFAMAQPDTPGKLVAHAFSYEHMEQAAYDLLGRTAQRAGDEETVQAAHAIERQEIAMADRLAQCFDRAVDASLRKLSPDDLPAHLHKYLGDAHAIEGQAIALLDRGRKLAGTDELASTYATHRAESEEHQRLLAGRLAADGAAPSKVKDAVLRLGALNWGAFFGAQPDTPAKLAAFAYAFEHLEIAAYELLGRVARRAGDPETEQTAATILAQERAAAERVRLLFDQALSATLENREVGAPA